MKNIMFNAPIYFEDVVTSTMDVSRKLAAKYEPHGTVVVAEYQEKGRGRGKDRVWQTKKGESLLFTVLLCYQKIENIPIALTLRTGLAVASAIEEFQPALKDKVKIKWPNDVLINEQLTMNSEQCKANYKKAAGILCEADGGTVYAGIGVNVAQKEFPQEIKEKATSIALASGADIEPEKRVILLDMILKNIYEELSSTNYTNYTNNWKQNIEQRLYKINEQVTFIEGAADSGKKINGILTGIGDNGELLIDNQSYVTGELKF